MATYELPVKILTSPFDSLTPISLQGTIFRRFEDVFCWLLHWISWISAIFLFRSRWPTDLEKCATWCAPRDESFYQVWSWYDYPLPSYSIIAAHTLRDLVTLTFDLLTLVSASLVVHGGSRAQSLHQVWRSYGYTFLSYEFWQLP